MEDAGELRISRCDAGGREKRGYTGILRWWALLAPGLQVGVETSQRFDSTAEEEDEQRSHSGNPLLEGLEGLEYVL